MLFNCHLLSCIIFDRTKGNVKPEKIVWPTNNGSVVGTEKKVVLQKGYQFDRYGLNGGSYVSPVGTPYGMRSLAPGTELKPYKTFEVVKSVRGEGSIIAPWFDQPGGGVQIKLNSTIQELLDNGSIREVIK
ncbi:TNT domain-containing protein [Bacillus timonensis]|nr:TNT domain-containing protein [Bacillus timonensis]